MYAGHIWLQALLIRCIFYRLEASLEAILALVWVSEYVKFLRSLLLTKIQLIKSKIQTQTVNKKQEDRFIIKLERGLKPNAKSY